MNSNDWSITDLIPNNIIYILFIFGVAYGFYWYYGDTTDDYMERYKMLNNGKEMKVSSLHDARSKCAKMNAFPPSVKYLQRLNKDGKLDKKKLYAWSKELYLEAIKNAKVTDDKLNILFNANMATWLYIDPNGTQKMLDIDFFNPNLDEINFVTLDTYTRNKQLYTLCITYNDKE